MGIEKHSVRGRVGSTCGTPRHRLSRYTDMGNWGIPEQLKKATCACNLWDQPHPVLFALPISPTQHELHLKKRSARRARSPPPSRLGLARSIMGQEQEDARGYGGIRKLRRAARWPAVGGARTPRSACAKLLPRGGGRQPLYKSMEPWATVAEPEPAAANVGPDSDIREWLKHVPDLNSAFRTLDVNGDGFVSPEELRAAVEGDCCALEIAEHRLRLPPTPARCCLPCS